MKIRIKDIARLAQVSPGTVDRVIHNRGEVSEKTRAKIEGIIQDLNYQPDILASTLAMKKQYVFAVVMPVSANGNDFWQAPNTGINKALDEIGHFGISVQPYLFDQFEVSSFNRAASSILHDKPDAVLFAPVFPGESARFIESCREKGIPLLLFNSNLDESRDVPYIGQNALQSGYLGASLITYGWKEAGEILIFNIAGRKDNHNHILRRERGFRKYFADHDLERITIKTLDCPVSDTEHLQELLVKNFRSGQTLGIFVTNSRVYRMAELLSGEEFSPVRLVGYDLLPENVRYLKSGVIDFLISQKPEEQGYRGIMHLFQSVVLKRSLEKINYLPIDIVTRENIDYYEYK